MFKNSKYLSNYILPILLFSIIWGAIEFLLPIFLSQAKMSVTFISILFAIISILSITLDIPIGKLSDIIGRKKLILYSMIVSAIALFILYKFTSTFAFVLSAILIGVAYGLNWSPLLAFVGDKTKEFNQGRVFGTYFSLESFGEAVSPLILVLVIYYTNLRFPFLLLTFLALFSVLMFSRIKETLKKRIYNAKKNYKYFSFNSCLILIKKSTHLNLFILASGFFTAFFWQSVWFSQPLIGFYEDSILNAALIVATFSLPTILLSKFLGYLIDKIESKKIYVYSIISVIISFLLFYLIPSIVAKIILIFIAAIGVLGIKLTINVLVVRLFKSEHRGEFFGILETIKDIAYAITPLFIGISYKLIGLDGIFIANSAFALLLFMLGFKSLKKLT